MKKHWLAVIRDHELCVARVAVGKNKEVKVLFLSEYTFAGNGDSNETKGSDADFAGIRSWLQKLAVPVKQLKLAVSSVGLITRVITLPQMSNRDLEKLIGDHIDQYFTLNIQQYITDYRILSKYRENGKPMMNVLLAAFPRARMQFIWSLCRHLGFEPQVVDLTADCLTRLYASLADKVAGPRLPESEPGTIPGDIAVVSLDGDEVEFVLLENAGFFLYSDLGLDLRASLLPAVSVVREEKIYASGAEETLLRLSAHSAEVCLLAASDEAVRLLSARDETYNFRQDDLKPEDSEANLSAQPGAGPEQGRAVTGFTPVPAEDKTDSVISLGEFYEQRKAGLFNLTELEIKSSENLMEVLEEDIFPVPAKTPLRLDFSLAPDQKPEIGIPLLDLEEPEDDGDDFKQAELRIGQRRKEQKDFILEDLFIPGEDLTRELALTTEDPDFVFPDLPELSFQNEEEASLPAPPPKKSFFDSLDFPEGTLPFEKNETFPGTSPKAILENGLSPVLTTLSELLSFFAARHFGQTVNLIYLTGELCTLPYLEEIFQENLGVKTVTGFPKNWRPELAGDGKTPAGDWQKYGSIYGLALRED
jgi:Tfp pilus assembly PilM family ATPase